MKLAKQPKRRFFTRIESNRMFNTGNGAGIFRRWKLVPDLMFLHNGDTCCLLIERRHGPSGTSRSTDRRAEFTVDSGITVRRAFLKHHRARRAYGD